MASIRKIKTNPIRNQLKTIRPICLETKLSTIKQSSKTLSAQTNIQFQFKKMLITTDQRDRGNIHPGNNRWW